MLFILIERCDYCRVSANTFFSLLNDVAIVDFPRILFLLVEGWCYCRFPANTFSSSGRMVLLSIFSEYFSFWWKDVAIVNVTFSEYLLFWWKDVAIVNVQ